jgi:DUF4097 and DUF4098 domain-containing protein YvlB
MRSICRYSLAIVLLVPLSGHAAEQAVEERRSVAADAQIELGNVRGRLDIQGWDRDEIEITGSLGEGVKGLIIEGDERRLSVRVDYPRNGGGGWFGWWGGDQTGDSSLSVKLPRRASLEVESVSANVEVSAVEGERMSLSSVSGDIGMSGSPKRLEVSTVSGTQRLDSASADVRMETVSGQIRLKGATPQNLGAESVSGDIELQLEAAQGAVSAETVSGDVRLTAARLAGQIRIESMSGSIDLLLPSSGSARLQASSFSGTIDSDAGEVERRKYGPGASLTHVLGNGDANVSVETFSGRIKIRLE